MDEVRRCFLVRDLGIRTVLTHTVLGQVPSLGVLLTGPKPQVLLKVDPLQHGMILPTLADLNLDLLQSCTQFLGTVSVSKRLMVEVYEVYNVSPWGNSFKNLDLGVVSLEWHPLTALRDNEREGFQFFYRELGIGNRYYITKTEDGYTRLEEPPSECLGLVGCRLRWLLPCSYRHSEVGSQLLQSFPGLDIEFRANRRGHTLSMGGRWIKISELESQLLDTPMERLPDLWCHLIGTLNSTEFVPNHPRIEPRTVFEFMNLNDSA